MNDDIDSENTAVQTIKTTLGLVAALLISFRRALEEHAVWQWGLIRLRDTGGFFGRSGSQLGGRFAVPNRGDRFVRAVVLTSEGAFRDAVFPMTSILAVQGASESEVRAAALQEYATTDPLDCGAFTASPILPNACGNCGCTEAEHALREDVERRRAKARDARDKLERSLRRVAEGTRAGTGADVAPASVAPASVAPASVDAPPEQVPLFPGESAPPTPSVVTTCDCESWAPFAATLKAHPVEAVRVFADAEPLAFHAGRVKLGIRVAAMAAAQAGLRELINALRDHFGRDVGLVSLEPMEPMPLFRGESAPLAGEPS